MTKKVKNIVERAKNQAKNIETLQNLNFSFLTSELICQIGFNLN